MREWPSIAASVTRSTPAIAERVAQGVPEIVKPERRGLATLERCAVGRVHLNDRRVGCAAGEIR